MNNLEIKDCWHIFALLKTDDSVAQLVEHNTFNVGVLGSSPRRITKGKEFIFELLFLFYFTKNG